MRQEKELRPSRLRRILTFCGLAFIVAYCAWQGWLWWLQNEPLHRAAGKIARAFETQDVDTLWHYSDLGEKQAFHLDKAKFAKVFREYIWPHTYSLKRSKTVRNGQEAMGIYEISDFYAVGNREVPYNIVVFTTDEGPKTNTITPGVLMVFDIKYGDKHAQLSSSTRRFSVMLEGAVKERAVLENLGITGTKDSSPERQMVPWDRAIEILSSYLKSRQNAG